MKSLKLLILVWPRKWLSFRPLELLLCITGLLSCFSEWKITILKLTFGLLAVLELNLSSDNLCLVALEMSLIQSNWFLKEWELLTNAIGSNNVKPMAVTTKRWNHNNPRSPVLYNTWRTMSKKTIKVSMNIWIWFKECFDWILQLGTLLNSA